MIGDVTFDDDAVRRVSPEGGVEEVRWDDLAEVRIATTSDGPFADDVHWMLVGADGTGVAVPSESAPEGLVDRLQDLPGFDHEQMILAMGSVGDAQFRCWRRDGQ